MAWPTNNDNLPANHVDNIDELILALHVNRLDTAINALQGELGLSPSDTYSSVKARLDAIGSGGGLPGSPTEGDALVGGIGAVPVWSPKGADYNLLSGAGTSIVTGSGASAGQAATNKDAINTVLAAAAAQGRPVLFPPVTIMHTAGIVTPSNTYWRGFGKGRSILRVHASVGVFAGQEIITNSNVSGGNQNITLENFELDGNSVARGGHAWMNDGAWSGGSLTFHSNIASKNIKFIRMTQHHAVGVGMNVSGVDGLLVDDCEIYSNGRDGCSVLLVAGRTANDLRYTNNRIYDCGDDCIGLFAYDSQITNVVAEGNVLGHHSSFTNAAWQYGGHGIAMSGVNGAQINGNQYPNCAIGAIAIFNGYSNGTLNTENITINGADIQLPGTPKLGIPTVEESGHGIEFICQSGSGSIRNIKISNLGIQSPMGHMITMERRGGTGTINNVRISKASFAGGFGSNYYAGGAGIRVSGAAANNVRLSDIDITDLRGKAILGNGLGCSNWKIKNVDVVGCEKGSPGAGGPAMDIAGFVQPFIQGGSVVDFASPKNQSHAIGWGGASAVRLFNNDFGGAGRTGTVTGSLSGTSNRQRMNIDNSGAMIIGDAGTVGTL